ncbi:cardiolipin synthase [Paenibacillus uliginis N3/975]|uniref:Cardiolipin synthase n=1 Tax=Paenibacillus uliginis N3/975 TaxID=1313296 RepID=A0A1X7GPQ5_9BACL|nr:cardiolipin synthase [Paenibacillus uliginis]SMF72765.1 cardiolipin synthase [Paenibacillus uliginis N3/975]
MLWLLLALIAFICQMAAVLLLEFRNPSKTVAWLFILFCLPLVGFVLYFFMAQDYQHRLKIRNRGTRLFQEIKEQLWKKAAVVQQASDMHNDEFHHNLRLFNLLNHLSESPITGCNRSKVLTDGEETYAAMLQAMEKAKDHIHVEFYIFRHDTIGTKFQDVMIRKAKEGVKVRLICDGLGSYKLKNSFVRRFKESGVEVHFFLPAMISVLNRRINYRNHRKIVIVDGIVGFLGGINVGDDYLGKYQKMGYWRDTHLEVEGDAVYFLQNVFLQDWKLAAGEKIVDLSLFPKHHCTGEEQVQILSSGPDMTWNAIQEMCFGSISVAKERIWITTPYFIPDEGLFEAIKTAAVSGVDVRIIIPDKADSRLVKLASLSYVEDLLTAGVRFYEYKKGFIHAKVLIVDDLIGSVGTANMDMRSFFCNFELTAVLFDKEPIKRLVSDFEEDLRNSGLIDTQKFHERGRLQKVTEILSRMLSPLL